jgi:hypothetical protein
MGQHRVDAKPNPLTKADYKEAIEGEGWATGDYKDMISKAGTSEEMVTLSHIEKEEEEHLDEVMALERKYAKNPLDISVKGVPTSPVGAVLGNPYSPAAKYDHHRQVPPQCFESVSFKTVPLEHTEYPRTGRYRVPGAIAVTGRLRKGCKAKFGIKGKRVRFHAWAIQSILTPKAVGMRVTSGERALENPVSFHRVMVKDIEKYGKRFHAYTEWVTKNFRAKANPSIVMAGRPAENPWKIHFPGRRVKPMAQKIEVKEEEKKPPETEEQKKKKKRSWAIDFWNDRESGFGSG